MFRSAISDCVIMTVCMAWFGPVISAQSATSSDSVTFAYRNSKSYEELTNSIAETKRKLDATERMLGINNTNVADLLSDLAGFYDDLGDYPEMLSLLERSLAIREKLLGPQSLAVADDLNDIGWAYLGMEDFDHALPYFRRSLTVTEALLGGDHYEVATTLSSIADLYQMKGDYREALAPAQRALAIRLKSLGEAHPDLVDSFVGLARIFRGLGNHQEALNNCQRGMAIARRSLPPEHPLAADALFTLAGIHADVGNYADALPACQRALAIDERLSGLEHPDVLEALSQLAVLFAKQNNYKDSLSAWVEFFTRQRRYLVRQVVAVSDREALRLLQHSFQATEFFHSVCAKGLPGNHGEAAIFGAEELALNKGFLETVRTAQAAFEANPPTATKELRDRYHALQVQIEHCAQSDPQMLAKRQALQKEMGQLEMDLAERVSLVEKVIRERKVTLREIAQRLPKQSALVDFVEYRRADLDTHTNKWCERRYAAYLTFPLQENLTNLVVERVDLGDAGSLDTVIELITRRLSAGQYRAKDLQEGLQF
jgi:tetratricopeptide (TPR) repeat protein